MRVEYNGQDTTEGGREDNASSGGTSESFPSPQGENEESFQELLTQPQEELFTASSPPPSSSLGLFVSN